MDVCLTFHDISRIEEQGQDRAQNISENDSEQDRSSRPDALCEVLEYDDEDQYRKTYEQVGRRTEVLIVVASAE